MPSPLLYEINTRCWLRDLGIRQGRPVRLPHVPESEFDLWRRLGFTHIWLMGVWTTGPRARALALADPNLRQAYDRVLPGWRDEDVAGSPYSIADYRVPEALGGEDGLKEFRARLHRAGLRLVLDFVPNHMGLDHVWIRQRPDLFVQSAAAAPGTFPQATDSGPRWIANGKDPYFPPWTDVAQLDYRRAATREAMKHELQEVAARCDGVRCDMAMLLLNEVFARTWSHLPIPETPPASEFWAEAIPEVKRANPEFAFMAEVYWGLEARMQSLGFDFTYDKELFDLLIGRQGVNAHHRITKSPPEFIARSAHFLENHDEPRVAASLDPEEHCAAALTVLGLPGMRFLHEGQLSGARARIPVQLARRPAEPSQPDVERMYERLLTVLRSSAVGQGRARILSPRPAWPQNPTDQNFVLVQWRTRSDAFDLVVVNLAPHRSQCFAHLEVEGLEKRTWRLKDMFSSELHDRRGDELRAGGLYLDLPPHRAQLFHFEPGCENPSHK